RPGSPPYLRYDAPLDADVVARQPWLEVHSLDGARDGRGEVPDCTGVHEVEIAWRERAVLRGRVIDEQGAPVAALTVRAAQTSQGARESLESLTAADGTYQLSAAEPGWMQLAIVVPSERTTHRLRLEVPRGVTRAPDVVAARRASGSIRGRLECRHDARW